MSKKEKKKKLRGHILWSHESIAFKYQVFEWQMYVKLNTYRIRVRQYLLHLRKMEKSAI